MDICMISGRTSPPGGVETVVNELAKYVVAQGANITIFGKEKANFVKKTAKSKIIGIKPFRYLPYPKYAYSFEVWKRIEKEGSFDIIHGHGDNCFFPSLLRGKTPFIVTFHGTIGKAMDFLVPHARALAVPSVWTEKVAALRCDLGIACSQAVKNELVTLYGANPNRITIIYNGVDVDKFVPQDKTRARKRLGLPLKNRYGLWVGGDPVRKRLSIAIRAVENIPNLRLLVAGINSINDGNAVYLGKPSESDLITAYNAADFLLFPTVYEGFPLVPLEALACGIPIIVSKESNMDEIITEGIHGFVVQDSSALIYKDRIKLLLNDSKNLKDMSIQCRKLATNYRWEEQTKQYWKTYLKLTGQT